MSGLSKDDVYSCHDRCERPVCVAARAAARAATRIEREKVAEWMMQRGYATGHGDTIDDLLAELDWQIRESEREACAKLCDAHKNPIDDPTAPVGQYESGGYITAEFLADAIRARGNNAT